MTNTWTPDVDGYDDVSADLIAGVQRDDEIASLAHRVALVELELERVKDRLSAGARAMGGAG